jgi:hypothetical protein
MENEVVGANINLTHQTGIAKSDGEASEAMKKWLRKAIDRGIRGTNNQFGQE